MTKNFKICKMANYFYKLSTLTSEDLLSLDQISQQINPNDKIILSGKKIDNFITPSAKQEIDYKPRGLWYSCGNEWIELEDVHHGRDENYLYRITLNMEDVRHLKTKKELERFSDHWYQEQKRIGGRKGIDWSGVAQDYSGIEISPYLGRMEKKNCQWYDTWDIASGCIWSKDAFVNVELIAEKDTHSGLWKVI